MTEPGLNSMELASSTSLSLPALTQEFITHVETFTTSRSPEEIERSQRAIQAAQNSEDGLQLAESLLSHDNEAARLFAAQAFVVRINRNKTLIPDDRLGELRQFMLQHYVSAVLRGEAQMVTYQLILALLAIFKRAPSSWPRCVPHVIASLISGIATENFSTDLLTCLEYVKILGEVQLLGVIRFCLSLSLVAKETTLSTQNSSFHAAIEANMACLLAVSYRAVKHFAAATFDPGRELWGEGIELLQHLMVYIEEKSGPEASNHRQTVQKIAFNVILELYSESRCFEVANFALSLIDDHPEFMSPQMRDILEAQLMGQKALECIQKLLIREKTPASHAFAMLLIAFCRHEVKQFLVNAQDTETNSALFALLSLIKCEEQYTEQNGLLSNVIDFWCSYVEEAVETLPSSVDVENFEILTGDQSRSEKTRAAEVTMRAVVNAFMEKLKLPPDDEIEDWDDEARDNYYNVRRDFRDLVVRGCALMGRSYALNSFVSYAVDKCKSQAREDVEISLQCFLGCMEATEGTLEYDVALKNLFSSNVMSSETPQRMHDITTKPVMQIIRDSGSFCTENEAYTIHALEYIFRSLRIPKFANDAARTLVKFCNDNQKELLRWIRDFMAGFDSILSESTISNEVREKLIGAMASVSHAAWVYAADKDVGQQDEADQMLTVPLRAIRVYYDAFCNSAYEDPYESALTCVRCLAHVSKAFEEAVTIDLDGEDKGSKFDALQQRRPFVGSVHNSLILIIERILKAFPKDASIMEAVCDIIRPSNTGIQNPFAFHADFVETLLSGLIDTTLAYEYLLSTVFRFLRRWDGTSEEDHMLAARWLAEVYKSGKFTESGPDSSLAKDPDNIAACLDFIGGYVVAYPKFLFELRAFEQLGVGLDASVACYLRSEQVLIDAANKIWLPIFDLQSENSEIMRGINDLLGVWGPKLAFAMMQAIGGKVPRSKLVSVIQPLRKLIVLRGGAAGTWLKAALEHESFPSNRVSDVEKNRFLQSILKLRGQVRTNKVAMQFWEKCSGALSLSGREA